jgi:hypothetical protein
MKLIEDKGFLFRTADYGPDVSAILAVEGDGERLFISSVVFYDTKHREESRCGTQECVRHEDRTSLA